MSDSPHAPISRRALLAGVAGTGLAGLLAACSATSSPTKARTADTATSPAASGTTSSSTSSSTQPKASATSSAASAKTQEVSVMSVFGDGAKVGVGMPIVLMFSPSPTDATAFVKAAKVTVNGQPVTGAWRWSQPYAGEPMQAHFRMQEYWPANATIELELPIAGLSAGKGLAFSGALSSLKMLTGHKVVTTVDGLNERADVVVNDSLYRTMRVSLGKSQTPTTTGTKLVMQKGEDVPGTNTLRPDGAVRMQNTEHTYNLLVDWSVRITQSGEYLHAAPWNSEIGQVSTSDGCTNLSTSDAKWFYSFATIGDIVIHKNTGGSPVQLWDGYTDWNIPWATYQRGGLLSPT